MASASKLLVLRRLSVVVKPPSRSYSSVCGSRLCFPTSQFHEPSKSSNLYVNNLLMVFRNFWSRPLNLDKETQGPAAIDYSALLQEDEFHRLADSTIHDLQEKFEEYGDEIQVDGFDIDYGNEVLTLKFGSLGAYVLNKQTPNRQIWLSSPVSGPSRFDWDRSAQAWIYRRNKANLLKVLESEVEQLCGKPISLC